MMEALTYCPLHPWMWHALHRAVHGRVRGFDRIILHPYCCPTRTRIINGRWVCRTTLQVEGIITPSFHRPSVIFLPKPVISQSIGNIFNTSSVMRQKIVPAPSDAHRDDRDVMLLESASQHFQHTAIVKGQLFLCRPEKSPPRPFTGSVLAFTGQEPMASQTRRLSCLRFSLLVE